MLAVVVLLVSFVPVLAVGASGATRTVLALLHVAVGAVLAVGASGATRTVLALLHVAVGAVLIPVLGRR